MVSKYCSQCKDEKTEDEFHKHSRAKDGLQNICKDCNIANGRIRDKDYWRKMNLKRSFGITVEQYDELFEKQNGCCAVCEKHQDNFRTRLAVDHNHKTGEIRGLLCNNCNRRFIGRYTDGTLFERAAVYLGQGTGLFVPEKKRTTKKRRKKKETSCETKT